MATVSVAARSGLVGHPSDAYGGATLGVSLGNFCATVEARPAARLDVAPAGEGQWPEGGRPLIAAAVARFCRDHAGFDSRVRIRYRSTIPRQLGLGGSSAIVIATLRALAELAQAPLRLEELAATALAVETEELGIAAGLQDRVVQAYGGLVFMDFAQGRYERLAPELLPDGLFVAWRPEAGGASGAAHRGVRARFAAGERAVVAAMDELAQLADRARDALVSADHAAFAHALSAGYDVRARIFELDPRHTAMIDRARALGLPATYTGSGGAITGVAPDAAALDALAGALAPLGARVDWARVSPAGG